ncbi:hypothetical protein QQS21_007952 [Conoideocrella luteorostrata]|uniref:Uncharacterized protein n=1 Tax=Conoideocrella luteorostrata TaxID=1105319 RepID=A0AAJ0CP64_9HYPO|nr:hypothetical protein QQS21_007952 [Conoideocrella luteorostrata]
MDAAPPAWYTTHGLGAIKDTESGFVIAADSSSAKIRPSNLKELAGWIHYCIPNPGPNRPTLSKLRVDFSSQSATVDKVKLSFANEEKFKADDLQMTSSFQKDIRETPAYTNKGIEISVYIAFDNLNSWIKFQSVGVLTP